MHQRHPPKAPSSPRPALCQLMPLHSTVRHHMYHQCLIASSPNAVAAPKHCRLAPSSPSIPFVIFARYCHSSCLHHCHHIPPTHYNIAVPAPWHPVPLPQYPLAIQYLCHLAPSVPAAENGYSSYSPVPSPASLPPPQLLAQTYADTCCICTAWQSICFAPHSVRTPIATHIQ